MKKCYKIPLLITLGLFSLLPYAFSQQDMNYTQYFSTPIYYNPAYTGINTGLRARFLFRDQWPTAPIDYKSYYFSADIGDRGLPGAGGFGIQINSDTPGAGLINNFAAALTVGVRIPITSFMVSQIGIKAGIMQRSVNWGSLVFADQLDPKWGPVYQTAFVPSDASKRTVPDFGVGGLLQFSNPEGTLNGNLGFAVDHIFMPDVGFLTTGSMPYPRKWVGHFDLIISTGPGGGSAGGMSRSSDEPLKINIGGLYQNQAGFNSLQVGLNLLKFNIYIGGWYKTTMSSLPNSAMAVVAGYKYNFYDDMSLKFLYSYDIQISGALQGTGGAHEIGLVLEFNSFSIFGGGGGGSGGFVPGGAGRNRSGPLECPSFY
jgi:type IX secretion system PorP/SprF family membrane protein